MNIKWPQSMSQYGRWMRFGFCLVLLVSIMAVVGPGTAFALNPAPVQVYFVTLPEEDAHTVLNAIHNAADPPMWTYFSIAIGVDGTYIYYDQWEDGYAADIANPTGAEVYSGANLDGVQIWGNGEADDGCAPNISGVSFACTDGADVLGAGDVIIPYNSVPEPRPAGTIRFDGMDKVGATDSIAMARAVWASGSSTLNAYAHEMYSTAEWGTAYEAPVGSNTAYPGTSMFQYSALTIMAGQNNTTVQIDADANGVYETNVILQEGGTTLVTGTSQGAAVLSDNPVQVVLLTGDIGDTYESRDMTLLPVSAFGSSYWSPVGVLNSTNPTRIWLYNPSANSQIYITCERYGVASTTYGPVAKRGVVTTDLGANQGAHCYASLSDGTATTDPIFAVGTVDTNGGDSGGADGSRTDWSFTLYPDGFLTTDALVGLGLGKDPTNTTSTQNGSPLWVTPVCNTYVYVDWDNDGTADGIDTNGDDVAEAGSQNGILVNKLQSVRLFEPVADEEEYDQSGARVWSRTASGVGTGGTPGCDLALAWGQDPANASAASPGLDVGTSVPPLRPIEGTKSLTLELDADHDIDQDGLLSPGDVATYNITIKNAGSVIVNDVYVYDEIPVNTTYDANSTEKDIGGGWVPILDSGGGDGFPLDAPGGVLLGNLAPGATFYVRFDVTLDSAIYEELLNCFTAYTGAGTLTRCVTDPVATNDWGDLPDSYGTTAAANGPRHSLSGLMLGSRIDREVQGQPDPQALGDDYLPDFDPDKDDEDGVEIAGSNPGWWAGSGLFKVTVTGGSGCLNAWMDFTDDTGSGAGAAYDDGNFTLPGGGYDTYINFSEHIIQNVLLTSGTTYVPVLIPPNMYPQESAAFFFRFRLSPTNDLGTCTVPILPTGFVSGGEVEDYLSSNYSPLSASMGPVTAEVLGSAVLVQWESLSELDIIGFHVERAPAPEGPWTRLTDGLIMGKAMGSASGAIYDYLDTSAAEGDTYYYRLVTTNKDSTEAYSDAFMITVPVGGEPFNPPSPSALHRVFIPIVVK